MSSQDGTLKEKWKDIKGYEGLYKVSNLGRVKSLDRITTYYMDGSKCIKKFKGKILKFGKYSNGRYNVDLSKNGNVKKYAVSRIVGNGFLGLNLSDKNKYICHRDDNPLNNNVNNLFIGDAKINLHDAAIKGRMPKGEKNGNNKHKIELIVRIKNLLKKGYKQFQIIKMLSIKKSLVNDIASGKSWSHIII